MVIVKDHDIESSNWPSSISRRLEESVNAIKITTSHIKLRSFDKNTLLKGKSLSPLRQVCSSKTHRHKLAKLGNEQGASFYATLPSHAAQQKPRYEHGKEKHCSGCANEDKFSTKVVLLRKTGRERN